jgi:hypothetical protein
VQQLLRAILSSMSTSNVDSVLRSIASSNQRDNVEELYTDASEVTKESGRPTNNVFLHYVHGETKRTADEVVRLSLRIESIEDRMDTISSHLERLCSLTEAQNKMLSLGFLNRQPEGTKIVTKGDSGGARYYQTIELRSKHHVYACIIFHLIEMVQTHMDVKSIHYPDSVDCDFNTMTNAVRVVSTERCRIAGVSYKNNIVLKEKDSQSLQTLYPSISSNDKSPTTLAESNISVLSNPAVRGVMHEVEWIRQRLCHLDGILSIKQVDILKSIKHPIVKPDSDSELNWDHTLVKPRSSHPLSKDISNLLKLQKDEYMKLRMQGVSIYDAFEKAKEYSSSKK